MTKILKVVFVVYLSALLWLVLFKFSFAPPTTQVQVLNLVPFAGNGIREMWDNFIVFIPFGLLLSATFKQLDLRRRLMTIGLFSLALEVTQFIFAIGATDITDVIMNTLGGLAGLGFYDFIRRQRRTRYLDVSIAVVVLAVLIVVILLRILVLKVRY